MRRGIGRILRALQPPMCRLFVVAQPGGQNASQPNYGVARPTSGHQTRPTTSHREPQGRSPNVGAPRPCGLSHRVLARCYTESAIPSLRYRVCYLSRALGVGSRRQSFALPRPNRVMTLDPWPSKETLEINGRHGLA